MRGLESRGSQRHKLCTIWVETGMCRENYGAVILLQKRAPKTSFKFTSKVPDGIAHKVKSAVKTHAHYKLLEKATKTWLSLGAFVWLFNVTESITQDSSNALLS